MGKIKLQLVEPVPAAVDADLLRRAIGFVNQAKDLPLPEGVINLKFVSDAEIKRLNRQYAGQAAATDVLAFSYIEDEPIGDALGDIVVSLDTAERQAEAAGLDLTEEAVILTLHGVLHILGLDHQTAADRAKMDAVQAKYAAQTNIKYRDFQWV